MLLFQAYSRFSAINVKIKQMVERNPFKSAAFPRFCSEGIELNDVDDILASLRQQVATPCSNFALNLMF